MCQDERQVMILRFLVWFLPPLEKWFLWAPQSGSQEVNTLWPEASRCDGRHHLRASQWRPPVPVQHFCYDVLKLTQHTARWPGDSINTCKANQSDG